MHRRTTDDLCVSFRTTASVLLLLLASAFSGVDCSRNSSERCEMSENGTCTLYFLVMAPYPDPVPSLRPSWEGGPAVVPAAMVARELINSREDILANYTIEFLIGDSGCNVSTKAINNATSRLFYYDVNVVGIIGPGCSEATLSVAPLVTDERLSLIQIAPSATSPSLTNTTLYPNTFRPIASALGFVDFYLELIEHRGYTRVGALFEDRRKFQTDVYNRFEAALKEKDIEVVSYGLFETQFPLGQFRNNNTRIIFMFSSIGFARQLLCIALHQGMIYPDYQFIFSNRKRENFIEVVNGRNGTDSYNCSERDMKQATVGVIFADFRLARKDRDDNNTAAQISYNEYSEKYRKTLNLHLASLGMNKSITTEHHSNYFDATWALALALNNSLPRLKEKGLSLSEYKYRMPDITQIVRDEVLWLSFEGMRGKVDFSARTHGGVDVTIIDFNQTLNFSTSSAKIVGFYNPSLNQPLEIFPNASLIPEGFDLEFIKPHISLGVLVMIATFVILVTLFSCQVVSTVWREHRTVKASSPRLNHIIFCGCYLFLFGLVAYTSAFVFSNASTEEGQYFIAVDCHIIQWTGTITLSLVFGILLVKTWRIYCIFIKFDSLPMKHLEDKTLLPIALIPFALDLIVNALWSAIDPWSFHVTRGEGLTAVASCRSTHALQRDLTVLWIVLEIVPKSVLVIIVLYFAIVTRQIHRKEYKQTKAISILIFCLLILFGVSLPLIIIVTSDITIAFSYVNYICISVLVLGTVLLFLVLLLLPPLIPLVKEKVFRRRVSDYTLSAINSNCQNRMSINY